MSSRAYANGAIWLQFVLLGAGLGLVVASGHISMQLIGVFCVALASLLLWLWWPEYQRDFPT